MQESTKIAKVQFLYDRSEKRLICQKDFLFMAIFFSLIKLGLGRLVSAIFRTCDVSVNALCAGVTKSQRLLGALSASV